MLSPPQKLWADICWAPLVVAVVMSIWSFVFDTMCTMNTKEIFLQNSEADRFGISRKSPEEMHISYLTRQPHIRVLPVAEGLIENKTVKQLNSVFLINF